MTIRLTHVVALLATVLGVGMALPASIAPDARRADAAVSSGTVGFVRGGIKAGVPLRYFAASHEGSAAVAALLYTGYPVRAELLGPATGANGEDVLKGG
jgi:hypothetical protein